MPLITVHTAADILPRYRGTTIERLLRHQNLGEPFGAPTPKPELLVGMCMEHRKDLIVPPEFAYVLRAASGNLRDSEFGISYAVGIVEDDCLVQITE